MAFLPCPHCLERVSFSLQHYFGCKSDCYQSFWMCENCGKSVIGESRWIPARKLAAAYELADFLHIYPQPKPVEAPGGTPDDVAGDFREAMSSLRNGNIKAACIMAGSAVETACVQFGATEGGLKQKIARLRADGIVTQSLAEWAEEIRGIRIDAAHQAERRADVTQKDAEDAVFFAEMLFTYLYTLPGMIEERRKREDAPS